MNLSSRLFLGSLLAVCCLAGAGCETRLNLTMKKDLPPIDRSVVSPKLQEKKFTKIIIVPSADANRSELEPRIMLIERSFLRLGVMVISPAITGRVVLDSTDKLDEKKVEAIQDLSDTERALIMSNATGAEAILELDHFKWIFPPVKTRYFIGEEKDESDYREVTYEQWASWHGQKRHFLSPVLVFAARVLDVKTGETVASFDLSMPANYTLPHDYRARYMYDPIGDRLTKSKLIGEYTFVYNDESWLRRAMERTEGKVMEHVAATIIAMPSLGEAQAASAARVPAQGVQKTNSAVVAPTETAATPPVSAAEKKIPAVRQSAAYSGHVASFKNEANATAFVNRMQAKGLVAFYRKEDIPGKGTFYRSYIGAYATSSSARQALAKLKKAGTIDFFQIRKMTAKGGQVVDGRERAREERQAFGKAAVAPASSPAPKQEATRNTEDGMKKQQSLKPTLSAEEHFHQAVENIAKEQYETALDDLNKAISQNDKFADAYSKRCFVYYISGNIDSAVKDCARAISLKPDFAEAYYNRGLAREADNQAESAIADYGEAIAIDRNYEAAYARRGYVHYLSKRNKQAIADYTQAILIKPDDDAVYLNRALVYYDSGDVDKAMADVQKSCSLKNEQACRIAEEMSRKE